MRAGFLGLGSALLLSTFSAGSADAQRVQADIRIGGRGPISGHIRIGDRDRRDYRRDYRPRRVRVEVIRRYDRFDRGRHYGWFNKWRRGARTVVVYYDRRDDCYYDRNYRSGLVEHRVYERDGRYIRYDDRDDRYGRDGRYDNRYDDRYDDRYRRGDDDRWDDRRDYPRDGRRDGRDW